MLAHFALWGTISPGLPCQEMESPSGTSSSLHSNSVAIEREYSFEADMRLVDFIIERDPDRPDLNTKFPDNHQVRLIQERSWLMSDRRYATGSTTEDEPSQRQERKLSNYVDRLELWEGPGLEAPLDGLQLILDLDFTSELAKRGWAWSLGSDGDERSPIELLPLEDPQVDRDPARETAQRSGLRSEPLTPTWLPRPGQTLGEPWTISAEELAGCFNPVGDLWVAPGELPNQGYTRFVMCGWLQGFERFQGELQLTVVEQQGSRMKISVEGDPESLQDRMPAARRFRSLTGTKYPQDPSLATIESIGELAGHLTWDSERSLLVAFDLRADWVRDYVYDSRLDIIFDPPQLVSQTRCRWEGTVRWSMDLVAPEVPDLYED